MKTKTFKNMNLLRLLSFLLSLVLLLFCFAGCDGEKNEGGEKEGEENGEIEGGTEAADDEALIEARIEEFLDAYNDGDMEEMIKSLSKRGRTELQILMGLVGGVMEELGSVKVDLSQLFSLGVSIESGDFIGVTVGTMQISPQKSAIVTTTMDLVGLPPMENELIYFEMVYEDGGWYIDDMSDEADLPLEGEEGEVVVEAVYSESDASDTVEVTFFVDGTEYRGIANRKGEIFFSVEAEGHSLEWRDIGTGAGFIDLSLSRGFKEEYGDLKYLLFDAKGNRIELPEEMFDEIIGWGDGWMLVYKDTSTITEESHSYGVIDARGNWVVPLKEGDLYPFHSEVIGFDVFFYAHIKDGWFWLPGEKIFYNSRTGEKFSASYDFKCIDIVDGVFYGRHGYLTKSDGENVYLPDYFALHSDGSFEEIDFTVGDMYGDYFVGRSGDSMQYWEIMNRTTKEISVLEEYQRQFVTFAGAYGDRLAINIHGMDGKYYYTVIDSSGNQLFAPKLGAVMEVYEDRIIYSDAEGRCHVGDFEGNLLASFDEQYTYVSNFKDGVGVAETDFDANDGSRSVLVGLDGKPIAFTIKEA